MVSPLSIGKGLTTILVGSPAVWVSTQRIFLHGHNLAPHPSRIPSQLVPTPVISGAIRVDLSTLFSIQTKGKFDIGNTISLWKKSFDQAMARGFKGLRVAGEMGFFFKHGMINELVVYERSLHRELETPLEAICAYDDTLVVKGAEEQHYLRLYLDLIVAHKITLFIGPEEAGVIRTT
jgi:hypothetical protein